MKLLKYIRDYKSNTGIVLASIYLLVLIWFSVEALTTEATGKWAKINLYIQIFMLTLPTSNVFDYILWVFGAPDNPEIGFLILFFSGVVNALVLYFSGYLLTRILVFLKDALLSVLRR